MKDSIQIMICVSGSGCLKKNIHVTVIISVLIKALRAHNLGL